MNEHKFKSDAIDACCQELKGHDNWAYLETLTPKQLKEAEKKATIVVFWDNE